ncbi:MAG: hypothetical protein WC312_05245 [Candidatus Omnitrophota bacterium]|jgi:hypothetical protein
MVTSKTFERLSSISDRIADAAGTSEEVVRKVLDAAKTDIISRRRQPAPPPPEGGISIRAAGRKYKIDFRLISSWTKRGLITVLLETPNNKYINENQVAELAKKYKSDPGRGKRTVFAK